MGLKRFHGFTWFQPLLKMALPVKSRVNLKITQRELALAQGDTPIPSLMEFHARIFSADWKPNPEPEGTASDLILVDEKNSDGDLSRALFRHSISFDQFVHLNKHPIS